MPPPTWSARLYLVQFYRAFLPVQATIRHGIVALSNSNVHFTPLPLEMRPLLCPFSTGRATTPFSFTSPLTYHAPSILPLESQIHQCLFYQRLMATISFPITLNNLPWLHSLRYAVREIIWLALITWRRASIVLVVFISC